MVLRRLRLGEVEIDRVEQQGPAPVASLDRAHHGHVEVVPDAVEADVEPARRDAADPVAAFDPGGPEIRGDLERELVLGLGLRERGRDRGERERAPASEAQHPSAWMNSPPTPPSRCSRMLVERAPHRNCTKDQYPREGLGTGPPLGHRSVSEGPSHGASGGSRVTVGSRSFRSMPSRDMGGGALLREIRTRARRFADRATRRMSVRSETARTEFRASPPRWSRGSSASRRRGRRPWRVLVLNGATSNLPAFVAIDEATQARSASASPREVEFFVESLDMAMNDQAAIEAELTALMRRKHQASPVRRRHHPGGPGALLHRPSPRGAVARGADRLPHHPRGLARRRPTTPARDWIPGPLRHGGDPRARPSPPARGASGHPRRRKLGGGREDLAAARNDLARFASRLELTSFIAPSVPALADMLANAAARHPRVLRVGAARRRGRDPRVARRARPGRAASAVPVLGYAPTFLGTGILGGSIESYESDGAACGRPDARRARRAEHGATRHPRDAAAVLHRRLARAATARHRRESPAARLRGALPGDHGVGALPLADRDSAGGDHPPGAADRLAGVPAPPPPRGRARRAGPPRRARPRLAAGDDGRAHRLDRARDQPAARRHPRQRRRRGDAARDRRVADSARCGRSSPTSAATICARAR